MDHRQLEVGVGVVDRLAAGLDEDHQREGDRAAPVRGRAPDVLAAGRGDHRAQVGAVRRQRGDQQSKRQQCLAEDRDRQITRGSHQREAAARVPRGGGEREAREREQADQDERVVAESKGAGMPGDRADRERQQQAGRRKRRREPVDDARALGVDGALSPQPRERTVGLQRRGAAPPLQARLERLDGARENRRDSDRGELDDGGDDVHPSTPMRTSTSRPATSANKYAA